MLLWRMEIAPEYPNPRTATRTVTILFGWHQKYHWIFLITNLIRQECARVIDVIALHHTYSENLRCNLGGLPNFEFVIFFYFVGARALILSCCA